MPEQPTHPYGEWPSPVTPGMVAEGGIDIGHLTLDGAEVYWREQRPDEDGRGVIVRNDDGDPADVTPEDGDVRTRVHEYGGGDFAVRDDTVWAIEDDDQRLYRQRVDGHAREPITPAPDVERGLRYADVEIAPGGDRLYCVRERHFEGDREPENALVTLSADGSAGPTVVESGDDFYAFPRVSPDGARLAWTTWNHPRMPWDGTELRVADVDDDGTVSNPRTVAGGPDESVFQPSWSPAGVLHAVSDRTGWWNLYRIEDLDDQEPINLHPRESEFGVPQWLFGLSTYAFLDDGRIGVVATEDGRRRLGVLEPGDGDPPYDLSFPDLPVDVAKTAQLRSDGSSLVFVAADPASPNRVVRWTPGGDLETLRRATTADLDPAYVSEPEHVTYPTDDERFDARGLYYPPHNPDVHVPDDEVPPLVVNVHGGPTSAALPEFDLGVQFWTTRGIGVFDVNYRGSTGYGRAYRDRLKGEWGVADAVDCVNAAEYLAERGRADPDRLAIRGGSAGGYATLSALAFHDAFDAGASYYGVADLEALATDTHKFESRYLDGLVGPYPEAAERYRERSPVHHADGIGCPLLLLQGDEDRVVPPEQAESMIDALEENGVPYAYVEFEGEQHGFRKADSRRRAAEAELAFYGTVFDFDPHDEIDPIDLVGGE